MRKYFYNEHYFDVIDSPRKAYWLGFFYADGYISKEGINCFGCGLNQNDAQQLKNFLSDIEINSFDCMEYRKDTNSVRFNLSSQILCNRLKEIGFNNKKSYDTTTVVWDNIPDIYKKDFLLGIWDGDGSFSITPTDHVQLANLVSNNEALIDAIVKYININLEANFAKKKERTPGDPYPRIRFSKNKAKKFGDFLYSNITYPPLQRKYDIYKSMTLGTQSHKGLNNYQAKGIICIENGNMYETAKECALKEFGLTNPGTANNIRAVCRGERQQTHGKHFRYMTQEERESFKNEQ